MPARKPVRLESRRQFANFLTSRQVAAPRAWGLRRRLEVSGRIRRPRIEWRSSPGLAFLFRLTLDHHHLGTGYGTGGPKEREWRIGRQIGCHKKNMSKRRVIRQLLMADAAAARQGVYWLISIWGILWGQILRLIPFISIRLGVVVVVAVVTHGSPGRLVGKIVLQFVFFFWKPVWESILRGLL